MENTINTIKLSTFEVAANDFSTEMNWKNAKEACLKLGGTNNEPLLYIYDDGTVEKKIILE